MGAALVVGLVAVVVLQGGKDAHTPPTGPRTVCARDLVLRNRPETSRGNEPKLYRGETFDVKRYAEGPRGSDTYAGGVARGRTARGEGWVLAGYLCDQR